MSDSPIYKGTIGTSLVPQVGARLHKESAFALDTLTIPYKCRTALIASLLPAMFSVPPSWFPAPGLFFTDYDTVSEEGLISQINLNYRGCLNGVVPPVYNKDGFQLQSVSTSTDKVSLSIQYRSPGTTYTWFETELPGASPRYYGVLSGDTALNNIATWSVKNNDGTGAVLYSDYVDAKNTLFQTTQVTQFDKELIVPGKIWKCVSTTSSVLVPAGA